MVALERAGGPEARSAMRDFIASPNHVVNHLDRVLAYYTAHPADLGDDEATRMVGAVRVRDDASAAISRVLDFLGSAFEGAKPEWMDELEAVASTRIGDVRIDCLVCLARVGDRGARRRLVEDADERVDEHPRSSSSWAARGKLYRRLGDYSDALRDYKKAYELAQLVAQRQPLGIELARLYALTKKPRQASEVLEELGLSDVQRRDLRADPDFANLVEHDRYGRVLD